ncbi:hypothetical protein [Streptomyces torulosus]|uniref:hypothetical protein n=1 Tax=Streptomyces torulosus TaxID=68276 RepID=UPI000A74260A|nr:hypothetical protein [Streptomyces torulosus]
MNQVLHPTEPFRRPAAHRPASYTEATVTGGPAPVAAPVAPQYHPVPDSEEKS